MLKWNEYAVVIMQLHSVIQKETRPSCDLYPQVPGFKPPNRINIIDLDPAYQTDKSANTSSYATQFDEKALVSFKWF